MGIYVFRINYDDNFNIIREEIKKGYLRQGWGIEGMDIRDSLEKYTEAWLNTSWTDREPKKIKRKYNNIRIMLDIKEGDYIVIPKLCLDIDYPCRFFTVVECTSRYTFSPLTLENGDKDFGHIIGVKPLFSCRYKLYYESIEISAKFNAYQSAVNNVWNEPFINAVKNLIKINAENQIQTDMEPKSLVYAVSQGVSEQYRVFTESILGALRHLDPHAFEDIITELFEKNGYILKRRNDYDKQGGDIDITLSHDNKTLLGCIVGQATTVDDFEINIQAKKKTGIDYEDKKAVEQLITRKTSKNKNNIDVNVVIDLADEFLKETEELAQKHKIILVNGYQFASLLVQFGMAGEISE